MLSSCSKKEKAAGPPSSSSHDLAAADFNTFIATPGMLNIVDFSATWCPPCKQLKPVLHGIADEHSDTVKLGVIDVDQAKSLAAQQGVQGIPDVRFYINGKQVDKFTGAAPKEHIEQIIANLLARHKQELSQTEETTSSTTAENMVKPIIQPKVEVPHPDLVAPPASTPAPSTPAPSTPAPSTPAPAKPGTTPAPAAPAQPTIQPAKGNQLPPGMSKG